MGCSPCSWTLCDCFIVGDIAPFQGLVMLEKDSGKVVLLTARVSANDPVAPSSAIDYANDVAVASNGIIYFTDSVAGIMPARNARGYWDTMAAFMLSLFNVSTPFPCLTCQCLPPDSISCGW